MTSVKEKNHGSPLWFQCRYLKHAYLLLHTVKKDYQACGGICNTLLIVLKSWRLLLSPKGGLAQRLCWKKSSPSAFSKCALTFPKQFSFLTQFYGVAYRALFRKCAFKQCPSTISRAAELCNLRMCSAQHNHHQMRNDKNSFVLPCQPAFHRLGKINEAKLFCPNTILTTSRMPSTLNGLY